jgi:nucleotide-binding universal stress UspA family protein
MTSRIEEQVRRKLRSVVVSTKRGSFKRIVKVGDPASKNVELAEKLDVDLTVMGITGLGNSDQEIGHVARKVLRTASKPVVLFK